MPLREMTPDDWNKGRSRVLQVGSQNAGKTRSLLTWPRPIHILSYPGEKGWATIRPDPAEGIHLYAFTDEHPLNRKSGEVIREVRAKTIEILSQKCGPCTTFAGDGLHKLGEYFLDSASSGAYFDGSDFDPLAYGQSRREMAAYITLVYNSQIPHAVFTVWDAPEKDRPQDKESKATHIWPDLPGKEAKRILGEFTATVYCTTRPTMPGKPVERVWQLQPDTEVWGIALKVPPGVVVPKYIPQDFNALQRVLDGKGADGPTIQGGGSPQ